MTPARHAKEVKLRAAANIFCTKVKEEAAAAAAVRSIDVVGAGGKANQSGRAGASSLDDREESEAEGEGEKEGEEQRQTHGVSRELFCTWAVGCLETARTASIQKFFEHHKP